MNRKTDYPTSPLENERLAYIPDLPDCFRPIEPELLYNNEHSSYPLRKENLPEIYPVIPPLSKQSLIQLRNTSLNRPISVMKSRSNELKLFKSMRIGIAFGGNSPSSGMHNVLWGVFDYLKNFTEPGSVLYGFLEGSYGVLKNDYLTLDSEILKQYRNTGGNYLLGYKAFRMTNDFVMKKMTETCHSLDLDGLMIVGGKDDAPAVAYLSEYLINSKLKTKAIFIPNSPGNEVYTPEFLPINLGFDSARLTLSEFNGNIATDSTSSKKYYHFIRCGSSLLTLESALQTRPTFCLIAEEVENGKKTLKGLVNEVCDEIAHRRNAIGKRSGTVLTSDGLFDSLIDMKELREAIHTLLTSSSNNSQPLSTEEDLSKALPTHLSNLYATLPAQIKHSLLCFKDARNRPLLPYISSERLLGFLVFNELKRRKEEGLENSVPTFNYRVHNFVQESCCPLPSNFDCTLGYTLGYASTSFISLNLNGYLTAITNIYQPPNKWGIMALPIAPFLSKIIDTDNQENVLIWPKYEVPLDGNLFQCFHHLRHSWKIRCHYRSTGPLQFESNKIIPNELPFTLLSQFVNILTLEWLVQDPESKLEKLNYPLSPPKLFFGNKTLKQMSNVQIKRLNYTPQLPNILKGNYDIKRMEITPQISLSNSTTFKTLFPHTHTFPAIQFCHAEDMDINTHAHINSKTQHLGDKPLEQTFTPRDQSLTINSQYSHKPHIAHNFWQNTHDTSEKFSELILSKNDETANSFDDDRPTISKISSMRNSLSTAIQSAQQRTRFATHSNTSPFKTFLDKVKTPVCNTEQKKPPTHTLDDSKFVFKRPIGHTQKRPSSAPTTYFPTTPIISSFLRSNIQPLQHTMKAKSHTLNHSQSYPSVHTLTHNQHTTYNNPKSINQPLSLKFYENSFSFIEAKSHTPQLLNTCTPPTNTSTQLAEPNPIKRIGVCFAGRPSPGGLNVISGVFDFIERFYPGAMCVGMMGGLLGLIHGFYMYIDHLRFNVYRNQGGLDLICRTTEHFRNQSELEECLLTVQRLKLDGLILLGGVTVIANSALLSELFLQKNCHTRVVCVPMAVDNSIPYIHSSLGHHTAVSVFSSIIGNLMIEARSSKCWYFIRISGESPSFLCAECAMKTHPTLILLSEEIEAQRMGIIGLVQLISDCVEKRSNAGMNYGVLLLPDNLLQSLKEMHTLLHEIDDCYTGNNNRKNDDELLIIHSHLTPWSAALLGSLPPGIQRQIAFNRDHSDKVDLKTIDTEILLKELVEKELARRKSIGQFKGGSFYCKTHFLAYQGRSALPSNFDSDLGYSYGYAACALVKEGLTGYLINISNLNAHPSEWCVQATPLTSLMDVVSDLPSSIVSQFSALLTLNNSPHTLDQPSQSENTNKGVPPYQICVLPRKLKLNEPLFLNLIKNSPIWSNTDQFCSPGPLQLAYNKFDERTFYIQSLHIDLFPLLDHISTMCNKVKYLSSSAHSNLILHSTLTNLKNLVDILEGHHRHENLHRNLDMFGSNSQHIHTNLHINEEYPTQNSAMSTWSQTIKPFLSSPPLPTDLITYEDTHTLYSPTITPQLNKSPTHAPTPTIHIDNIDPDLDKLSVSFTYKTNAPESFSAKHFEFAPPQTTFRDEDYTKNYYWIGYAPLLNQTK